ncbi:MAG: hypothetical protein PHE94_00700 [Eubacteriales bacterium]|nr:hypothetical protein [Eubacteriales bacterium]MDD4121395.1 hypothetical protein [Eubacteriales bacterium]
MSPKYADKNILEILYTMRYDKTQSESKIRKSLFLSLIPHEVLAHINLLVDKQLIKEERERIAAFKSKDKRFNIPAHTNITYRISDKGIKLYQNDFIEPERPYQPKTIFNISGGVVNFGTIHNLNINYIEELKVLIPEEDKRRDIEEYFNEIHEVAKNENIEKRRLKEIFNKLSSKIAEKGLDKIGDKLIDLLWLYFISNMSL